MAQLLYSAAYKKPGVYIGQIIEPSGDSIATAARIPVMIGKGSRYAQATNSAVVRAYVYEEELDDITATSPYTATLKHLALKDQSKAELVRKSDGYVIPEVKWQFGDDAMSIIISEDVYVVDDEYTLSYQSLDRSVLDPTPVLDIISVGSCGSSLSTNNYTENKDYFVGMSLENLKQIVDEQEVETEKLEFDPRYDSASIYPIYESKKPWLSVDAEKYVGMDNVELNLTATVIKDEDEVITGVSLVDEDAGVSVTITEEGKFVAIGPGVRSKIQLAINSFAEVAADEDKTAKVTVVAGKIFPTAKDNRKVTIKVTAVNDVTYTSSSSKDYLSINTDEYKGDDASFNFVATVNTTLVDDSTEGSETTPAEGSEVAPSEGSTEGSTEGSGEGSEGSEPTPVPVIDSITLYDSNQGISFDITAEGTDFEIPGFSGLKVAIASFESVQDGDTLKIIVTKDANYDIYYATNTPEGGFGTVKSDGDRIVLPGNIILKVNGDLAKDEQYSFELINQNVIDWSLTLKVSTYFKVDSVYRDVNGSKTGIPGSYYVILNGIPLYAPKTDSDVILEWIEDTSFVKVSTADGTKPQNFSISYEYNGNEPNPGDTYYLTTKHIRPDNMFNKVIFLSSRAEGEKLLAPSTSKNDLYIANEIAWDEIGPRAGFQIAYIQIKDSDEDGVLSSADVQTAIDALATSKRVTDYCLLGNFEYLGKMLAANELGNDPFECRENELWVGAPSGTIVGDINTEGSLVYIAQSAMKVYGNENPAHGTRILVAPAEATKKITLEGNIEQTIKLDGSFVAWGLACHRSRMRTADSIMRQTLTAFDSMQTYDDVEDLTLGSNQIVYFSKAADKIYVCEEDFTTDKYGFEFSLEQITSQRLQVVRDLRTYMNESLIGYTPDTPTSGVNIITSFLVRGLVAKIKEGVIAPYQNEDGTLREINPSLDIFVAPVKNNPTHYQFGYGFYTKKVMKVLFGSYVVDRNFVDTGLGN